MGWYVVSEWKNLEYVKEKFSVKPKYVTEL